MSAKNEIIYECGNCGAQSPKWQGRCLECGAWGTMDKSVSQKVGKSESDKFVPSGKVVNFSEIKSQEIFRLQTGILEFDRVLGGGIVPGSLILLGGEPGIGKSTLVLQVAQNINQPVLYISGEESAEQIKIRIDRLNISAKNIKFLGELDIETIVSTIAEQKPALAIIDSVQTIYSSELPSGAGSINQVRVCTVKLLEIAKKINTTILIIGHITKFGEVAGPKTLEHLVDTVLYLEGSQDQLFRILRTAKNRFGATSEIGVFDMRQNGLVEIKNPSKIFLGEQKDRGSSIVTAALEGSRVFLAEIQALVSPTSFGYPQRKSFGIDPNRLMLLSAVLTKKGGLNLYNQDIHLNVVGGLKIQETAADLAVCLAIALAFKNKGLVRPIVAIGEIGLAGEIRPVSQISKRISEAQKLGFKNILTPDKVKNLKEAMKYLD